jgi:hypothetical protein
MIIAAAVDNIEIVNIVINSDEIIVGIFLY